MAKRLERPTALGLITGALGKFAAQQAVHSVIDKFAAQIVHSPEVAERLARVMYEHENGTRATAWGKLADDERRLWQERVDVVVKEIAAMTRPRIGLKGGDR